MPMRPRRVTITDIASRAEVSRSTVSLVLREDARISQPTRDRVRRAIDDLGYTYNRGAANLRSQASQALGLVINDLTNPFFSELTAAVEATVSDEGYFVYLAQSGEDPDHQHDLVRSLIEHGVGGLILCPATGTRPDTLAWLERQRVAVCIAVRPLRQEQFDFSGPDNYRAGFIATQDLLAKDHRTIAFLGGERGNPSRDDRVAGYFAALQLHGLPFDENLVVESRPSRTSGLRDVERMLSLERRPTAALCYNDFVAISVMHGLRKFGVEPGRDIALIGFDGMPEAETSYPTLSSVALSPRNVGQAAARLLLERIKNPEAAIVRHVEAPVFQERMSSTTFAARDAGERPDGR